MEFRKKIFAFWDRSLGSGVTVGVVAASIFLILLLFSFDNSPSSSFYSLFSFSNNHSSSIPNLTNEDTFSQGTLQRPNQTASSSITSNSNVSVNESNLEEKPFTGNLGCNSNITSINSSCSTTDSNLGYIIGANMTKGSNGSVHSNAISTGSVTHEIVVIKNLTGSVTHEIAIKGEEDISSPSSNTNSTSHNVVIDSHYGNSTWESDAKISNNTEKTDWNANTTLPKPQVNNAFQNETHNNKDTNKVGLFDEKCDVFDGNWVRDESYPLYPPGSCPYIDDDFNCYKNGRPDNDFLKWRWQPNGCNIPRLNATDFLERLRGKRLLFVGDSLNRNMWESLVCILRNSVKDKSKVFEASGKKRFKTSGYYSFRFKDYKCYVDFVRSTFLVKEFIQNNNGVEDDKLRLDMLDETTVAYPKSDIIIFNTGHWWTHEKTSEGINYYQEGNHVYPVLKVLNAYTKALKTWASWIDKNINPIKTQIVFRGYSLTHFRGGQWNSGGQCHKETEPIFNEKYLSHYPSKNRALEQVLREMKTPVIYLNISRLTDYRKDAHPSIYRKKYNSIEEHLAAEKSQDCSHWCLPGVPDFWNELLYASLLKAGKGSWRN